MIYVRKISYHFNNFPFFPLESQLWIWVNTRICNGRIDGDSYVNLIRACKKVLYQLIYIGEKFVFLKEPLYLINQ